MILIQIFKWQFFTAFLSVFHLLQFISHVLGGWCKGGRSSGGGSGAGGRGDRGGRGGTPVM